MGVDSLSNGVPIHRSGHSRLAIFASLQRSKILGRPGIALEDGEVVVDDLSQNKRSITATARNHRGEVDNYVMILVSSTPVCGGNMNLFQ